MDKNLFFLACDAKKFYKKMSSCGCPCSHFSVIFDPVREEFDQVYPRVWKIYEFHPNLAFGVMKTTIDIWRNLAEALNSALRELISTCFWRIKNSCCHLSL